jgi:hypothetical protein
MQLGKRSAIAPTEAEVAALGPDELNPQTATLKYRAASQLSVHCAGRPSGAASAWKHRASDSTV